MYNRCQRDNKSKLLKTKQLLVMKDRFHSESHIYKSNKQVSILISQSLLLNILKFSKYHIYSLNFMIKLTECKRKMHRAYCDYWMVRRCVTNV